VSGDDTAEVRLLDLGDLAYADDIADSDPTARVLVELPAEGTDGDTALFPPTSEKTINIQQGGSIARVRVKLSTETGSWGAGKWRVVRHHGTLAIRVDLESGPQGLPETPAANPLWILWVILERNETRDSQVHPASPAD
jgi:hypothetical protein